MTRTEWPCTYLTTRGREGAARRAFLNLPRY